MRKEYAGIKTRINLSIMSIQPWLLNIGFVDEFSKGKMEYLGVVIANRVGIDERPSLSAHKVHGIDNGVELSNLPFPGSQSGFAPVFFFISEIYINGYLMAQEPRYCNNLAELLNFNRICLCY
jgi:hypothetical protein